MAKPKKQEDDEQECDVKFIGTYFPVQVQLRVIKESAKKYRVCGSYVVDNTENVAKKDNNLLFCFDIISSAIYNTPELALYVYAKGNIMIGHNISESANLVNKQGKVLSTYNMENIIKTIETGTPPSKASFYTKKEKNG